MADDANGRPEPTARRRRARRSTAADAAPGTAPETAPPTDQSTDEIPPSTQDPAVPPDVVELWPTPAGSGEPTICPFLRSVDDHGALGDPIQAPDPANRCAALAEAVPQSLRQQELVCLTSGHTSCPRYLRGAIVEADAPVERSVMAPRLTPATIAALALLAAAFSASVMFTFARGGLDLPTAGGSSPASTASAIAEVPSVAPSAAPSVDVSESPSSTPLPIPSTTTSPSPTASPTPSLSQVATPTVAPTSDRYALLKPCLDTPDCWIYVVRSGDNLFSIANYFGVPLATVKALNPWTADGLRAGRDLILPPPTR
jgi:LysM repeat protein